jgi:hypothetical protein
MYVGIVTIIISIWEVNCIVKILICENFKHFIVDVQGQILTHETGVIFFFHCCLSSLWLRAVVKGAHLVTYGSKTSHISCNKHKRSWFLCWYVVVLADVRCVTIPFL